MTRRAITLERWQDAQRAEAVYWHSLLSDDREFARILSEKIDTAHLAETFGLGSGDCVEIGIGPLGVGCAHFLSDVRSRAIVGVEPLDLIPIDDVQFAKPLRAVVESCRGPAYRHVKAAGEATGLEADSFAVAFCYNVLDHVHEPAALVGEAHRLLRPGGTFVVGVDVTSVLSDARHSLWVKHRFRDDVGVRAHPFRFRASRLLALVSGAGFAIRGTPSRRRLAFLQDLAGHAQRLIVMAEKV